MIPAYPETPASLAAPPGLAPTSFPEGSGSPHSSLAGGECAMPSWICQPTHSGSGQGGGSDVDSAQKQWGEEK